MRQPRYGDIFAGHDDGEAMAERAKILWAILKADLEGRGLWTDARGLIVDELVRVRVEFEHYYPIAVSEGPVRLSHDGNQYVNMLWSQCQKMIDQISKLSRSLTLTPESVGEKVGSKKSQVNKSAADDFLGQRAN